MTRPWQRYAFIDANVLYQSMTRDILLQAAADSVYRMRWSLAVREEVLRAIQRNYSDEERRQFEQRTMARVDNRFRNNLVFGYDSLETTLRLPDPDDNHVLAAAIHANCQYLVTLNLRDFPAEVCAQYGIEAIHPDEFLLVLLSREQARLLESARTCRMRMKNPSMAVQQYLDALRRANLPNLADALRFHAPRLA